MSSSSDPLSFAQLMALWISAGGDPAYAPTMAAVAYGESGGIPSAVQKGQPAATTGWGLWQITPGTSEPQVGTNNQLLDPLTNAKAAVAKFNAAKAAGENPMQPWGGGTTDPIGQISINQGGPLSLATAERLAVQVHGGAINFANANLFNPKWNAATALLWANTFLQSQPVPGGVLGALGLPGGGVISNIDNAASGIVAGVSTTAGLISDLTNANLWLRLAEGALGIFLIVIGGVIFFKGTASGQKLTSEATAAAVAA